MTGQNPRSELMTLPQVASYLGMAERTIYMWAQQGKLPAFKLGASWRFRKVEIDAWLETQRSGPRVTPGADLLTDPIEPPSNKRQIRLQEEEMHEALIEACVAFINTTMLNDDREVWPVEQFVDRFGEDVVQQAIKRLRRQKKLRVTHERGLHRERVRVIRRRS